MNRIEKISAFYGCAFLGLSAVFGTGYWHIDSKRAERLALRDKINQVIEMYDGEPGTSEEDWKIAVKRLYEGRANSVDPKTLRFSDLKELEGIILKD